MAEEETLLQAQVNQMRNCNMQIFRAPPAPRGGRTLSSSAPERAPHCVDTTAFGLQADEAPGRPGEQRACLRQKRPRGKNTASGGKMKRVNHHGRSP